MTSTSRLRAAVTLQLDELQALYDRHFADRPRATRSLERLGELMHRAEALLELAERGECAPDKVGDVNRAVVRLRQEASAIRAEASHPLTVLVADATTTAKIVEVRFRRALRTSRPRTWSPLVATLLHRDALRALAGTEALAPLLPPAVADRWVFEVQTLTTQIRNAADRSADASSLTHADATLLSARAERLTATHCRPARAWLESGFASTLWLHAEADQALRAADALAMDSEARSGARHAAVRFAVCAERSEDGADLSANEILEACERFAPPLVKTIFGALPCVRLTSGLDPSLELAVETLHDVQRRAVLALPEDAVLCTLPWLAEVRDALCCGERWLRSPVSTPH